MAEPTPKPKPKRRRCPICGRPASAAARPFCSKRCAETDLANWLGGVYAIPAETPPEDTDDTEA